MTLLVSVHLPKTAGASFGRTLEDHFGDALLKDYLDYPINQPAIRRNRAALGHCLKGLLGRAGPDARLRCIHGHFMPLKYRCLRGGGRSVHFVTWLRHPLDRMISHYGFWREHPELAASAPLHRRVLEEDWSLERFCLAPELRNLYRRFLWGFPLRLFDFVGLTEHYEADLARFSERYLGRAASPYRLNTGRSGVSREDLGPALRRRIEQYHRADMRLYRQACRQRPG